LSLESSEAVVGFGRALNMLSILGSSHTRTDRCWLEGGEVDTNDAAAKLAAFTKEKVPCKIATPLAPKPARVRRAAAPVHLENGKPVSPKRSERLATHHPLTNVASFKRADCGGCSHASI